MGQAFAGLEAPDPHLNQFGALDFCLTALLGTWKKADAPPARIKPLPLHHVHIATRLAQLEGTPLAQCASDCLVIGFYFCCARANTPASSPVINATTRSASRTWAGGLAPANLMC
ncbi:hypothetical protein MHU86_2986 [Fragilaria crotonensis]|nr:hypothetical protein MHU86_2986 [Fragilaria crotonensis]